MSNEPDEPVQWEPVYCDWCGQEWCECEWVTCPLCHGSGEGIASGTKCHECNGFGEINKATRK